MVAVVRAETQVSAGGIRDTGEDDMTIDWNKVRLTALTDCAG